MVITKQQIPGLRLSMQLLSTTDSGAKTEHKFIKHNGIRAKTECMFIKSNRIRGEG